MSIDERNAWEYGLPPLSKSQTGSKSTGEGSKRFTRVNFEESNFTSVNVNDFIRRRNPPKKIWADTIKGTLRWCSENDVQSYVVSLIRELIQTLGLPFQSLGNYTLFQYHPDVVILCDEILLPIAVIGVKKPGRGNVSLLENQYVQGQVYDYMTTLRESFGIVDVFGITTTWEEWKLCWFPDNQLVDLSAIPEIGGPLTRNHLEPINDEEDDKEDGEAMDGDPAEPLLCGTRTFASDDKELISMLMTFLLKCAHTRVKPVQMIDPDRTYCCVSPSSMIWRKIKFTKNFQLHYHRIPKNLEKQSLELLFLRELGSGEEGRCWLTCDKSGSVIVLKFSHEDNETARDKLENQALHWREVNKKVPGAERSRVVQMGDRYALAIPYLRDLRDAPAEVDKMSLALRAVETLGENQFFCSDLHLSNFGVLSSQKKGDFVAFLTDLGDVQPIDDVTRTQQRIDQMRDLVKQLFKLFC
eukprot:TRINITY_DN6036_c0_g2_i1.p1 TRINITY_DN6036_c0_g2~~TRINITY_DN6036_c0_g2_i1.p1  ORF type:complete len:470 (-),score=55.54 TRINITY_DN6036_c0_g2_i1:226-1635(-)